MGRMWDWTVFRPSTAYARSYAGVDLPAFVPLKLLIAGDTLFAGSIGRTDLPGGNFDQIIESDSIALAGLPDETKVLPGMGHLRRLERSGGVTRSFASGKLSLLKYLYLQ